MKKWIIILLLHMYRFLLTFYDIDYMFDKNEVFNYILFRKKMNKIVYYVI